MSKSFVNVHWIDFCNMTDTWSFSVGVFIAIEKNTYDINNFNIFFLFTVISNKELQYISYNRIPVGEISSPIHIESKLKRYVLNYNKGIWFEAWLFLFFIQDKRSVIYCKFYSPVPIFTKVCMGTQFIFDFCLYSLPLMRSINAHIIPFLQIWNLKSIFMQAI